MRFIQLPVGVFALLCGYLTNAKQVPSDTCCGTGCASTVEESNTTLVCAASLRPKAPPTHALKFCHIFPDESCCLPAQDAEIEEHYFNLLDAGDICAKESSMAKDALKKIFCASCSPKQPEYVEDGKFKICSSLATRVKPTCFDDCGMVRVAERGAPCNGDDVLVPSKYWKSCGAGDAVQWWDDEAGAGMWGGDECTPWEASMAANNVPMCCDYTTKEECSQKAMYTDSDGANQTAQPYSCTGFYKFINDDTAAKPPFLDDYEIEIVECDPSDGTECANICYTGAASRIAASAWVLCVSLIAAIMAMC